MVNGEVITLQFGSFSNFVCSHLWNLQASCFYYSTEAPFGHEFNHDVFYREGRNFHNEVTFNPRTVLIDLKGSLRSATSPVDHSYDGTVGDEDKVWDGAVQMHKAEPLTHSSKSEESGEAEGHGGPITKDTWAGYLQKKFHPKSMLVTSGFDVDNPQQPFNVHNQGEELWASESEEFEDRVRWFAEECDKLTGFNILADVADGFSGFTCKGMEYLEDDFRGKTRLVWSLFDVPTDKKWTPYRSLNTILAYKTLRELADLILPLAVTTDGIGRDLRKSVLPLDLSSFTGGAALALHIDSILSSLKLKVDTGCDFTTLPKVAVGGTQRKFAVSSMSTQPTKESSLECFTPKCTLTEHSTSNYVVTRASDQSQKDINKFCSSNADSTLCSSIKHPSKFSEEYFFQIAPQVVSKGSGLLNGIYCLHNSKSIVAHFDDLLKRKFCLNKMHRLNVPKDDIDEAVNALTTFKEYYSP